MSYLLRVSFHFQFEGTLLHEAVAIGNHEIVKLLLQSKPEVNARDKVGVLIVFD